MPKALVTGATGFVGSNLVRTLLQAGWQVRAVVRPTSPLVALEGLPVERVVGDLTQPTSLARAMDGLDAVFHVAALNAFWARDTREFYRVNVEGTRAVCEAALRAGVKRVVHTSTWAVFSTPPRGQAITEQTPTDPRRLTGPYRLTKYLAEREAMSFVPQGLDLVVVNPTVPVGPWDVKPTPTGRIVLNFLLGRTPAYVHTTLNLIAVEDVAMGHLLAYQKGRTGQRYLLGHRNITLREIFAILASLTGRKAPRLRLPIPLALTVAYADHFVEGILLRREPLLPLEGVLHAREWRIADCGKAVRELGLPQTSVEEALERAVRWFVDHGYVPRRTTTLLTRNPSAQVRP
ncbi:MAG: NAD-dependent epimerase/dehydratase family protein [Dehalococcoidia bacterium]|nr:NAD-dependent epimerase/dehydratase family protein [Dehalococcoidia bacterium]MDW8120463.1 NAD-dependent epimerase/dehydratase family protein [Chloroflexota bacterium]